MSEAGSRVAVTNVDLLREDVQPVDIRTSAAALGPLASVQRQVTAIVALEKHRSAGPTQIAGVVRRMCQLSARPPSSLLLAPGDVLLRSSAPTPGDVLAPGDVSKLGVRAGLRLPPRDVLGVRRADASHTDEQEDHRQDCDESVPHGYALLLMDVTCGTRSEARSSNYRLW